MSEVRSHERYFNDMCANWCSVLPIICVMSWQQLMLFAVHMLVFYMYCLVYGTMEGAGSLFSVIMHILYESVIFTFAYVYMYICKQACISV